MIRALKHAVILLILLGACGSLWVWIAIHGSVDRLVFLSSYPVTMAVDEQTGRVFISGGESNPRSGPDLVVVSVLDSVTGALLRTMQTSLFAAGAHCCDLPVTVDAPTHRVYVNSSGSDLLYILDAQTGEVRKIVSHSHLVALLPADVGRSVFTVVDGSRVTFSSVCVLDGRSGALLANLPCRTVEANMIFAGPKEVEYRPLSRLFIPARSPSGVGVCIVDPLRGRSLPFVLIHDRSRFLEIDALAVDERTARVFIASHLAMNDDTQSGDGVVEVLDARTGRVVGVTPTGPFPFQLVVALGRVYVLNNDDGFGPGNVSIFDAVTGRVLRVVPIGAWAYSESVDSAHHELDVQYGMQYGTGGIDRFDARDGRIRGHRLPYIVRTVTIGVDPGAHRLFVAQVDPVGAGPVQSRMVEVQDTRTKEVLRTIALPGIATAMAIDTRRHRGFIAVAGCLMPTGGSLLWLRSLVGRYVPWIAPPSSGAGAGNCVLVMNTN